MPVKFTFWIFIDQSRSMKVENYQNSHSLWKVLELSVSQHIREIFQNYSNQIRENKVSIYFFTEYNVDKNKKERTVYINRNNNEEIESINLDGLETGFKEQKPKGVYHPGRLKELLERWLKRKVKDPNNQYRVMIYTDGQLADRLEFVNLISDTCRQLDSQDKIKIMMIGIGIDNNSEVDLRFYLNIAANVYKCTNAKGEDCNIFGFDLLEEIEQMPNGIIDLIERQYERDIQKRLPKWVEQRDREWYNKYIGQS